MELNKINWVFFGTSEFSTTILDELKSKNFLPSLIVTVEDKPSGRKLILTPSPVKIWAEKENIPYIQPKSLSGPEVSLRLSTFNFQLFIVASYRKIIPKNILEIPKYKTLNIHPSLLPKFRGPSPIQSAILSEKNTGVTIIELDEEMDHGPIVAKKDCLSWNVEDTPYAEELEKELAIAGANLLVEILPDWLANKIMVTEQNHNLATFCKKIEKSDGEINLMDNPETNLKKIRSYHVWPGAYFFNEDKKRIVIKTAHIENGLLVLDRIVPEGKREMGYKDYLNGKKK
jgi:methionyl-tRNA formyltransferase